MSFNLSDWALRHRPFIGFTVVLLFVAGLYGLRVLHQREDPDFSFRVMVVRTAYPGATAQEVAQQVTDVLEKKLQDMSSLDYLKSYSKPGESVIYVYPRQDLPARELPEFWYQVRKKVGDIRVYLPPGAAGPFFNDEFGDTYSLLYAISGEGLTYAELKDVADDVRRTVQIGFLPDGGVGSEVGVGGHGVADFCGPAVEMVGEDLGESQHGRDVGVAFT